MTYDERIEDLSVVRRGFYREYNDCTVLSLMFATDKSYEDAHKAMSKRGRRRGGWGLFRHMRQAIHEWGMDWVLVHNRPRQKNGSRYTSRTITKLLPSLGRFLVEVQGHVYAVVDGQVMDEPKRGRVQRIYEVIR